jgi:hypothetical protein
MLSRRDILSGVGGFVCTFARSKRPDLKLWPKGAKRSSGLTAPLPEKRWWLSSPRFRLTNGEIIASMAHFSRTNANHSELADRVFAIMQRDAGSDGVVSLKGHLTRETGSDLKSVLAALELLFEERKIRWIPKDEVGDYSVVR